MNENTHGSSDMQNQTVDLFNESFITAIYKGTFTRTKHEVNL